MSVLRIVVMCSIGFLLIGCNSGSNDDDGSANNGMSSSGTTNGSTDGGSNATTEGTTDGSSTDSLTIAIVNNGHMINMQTVAQAYTDQTGIALNWVALDEETLRAQVLGDTATDGSRYDVINIGMQEAPIWGAAGWTKPLSFSDAYDIADVFPTVRNGLSSDGVLYAAPFYGESSVLSYRADLANAAAVQINDNDTWANIELAASAMHNPDEGIYGVCFRGRPGWGDNMALVTTIANSFGATLFDSEFKPQLDSAEWNAAVSFYVDLLTQYGPPNSTEISFNEILTLFNEGKCGMWLDSTIAPTFIDVDTAYAQAPNAGFPAGANWLWAWSMAIPTGAPNTDEALKFIEWATSKEYIQAVANHPDFGWAKVPTGTRASTYAISEFQAVHPASAAEKIAIESAAPNATALKPYLGIHFVSIPEFPEVGGAIGDEIAAALAGTKTVADALAAAQTAADDIMSIAGYY